MSSVKSVQTYVDIDLDDWSNEELLEEVEYRNLDLREIAPKDIENLYYSYLQDSPELFHSNLKRFFSKSLNINVL